ncbi:MAG: leucyl aminopeptidase [Patescibacteria group bacterium]|jgi:leucyl aminopeptidase
MLLETKVVASLAALETGLLVIPLPLGAKTLPRAAVEIDKQLHGRLTKLLVEEKLTGKEGESAWLTADGASKIRKILLLGTGVKAFTAGAARRFAATVLGQTRALKAADTALLLPETLGSPLREVAAAVSEGARLGDYRFLKYKEVEAKKRADREPKILQLLLANKKLVLTAERGLEDGELNARATIFARDLVNEPASVTTPKYLVGVAETIAAADPKRLSLKILEKDQLQELGLGGLLAVARGSDEPPYLIHLTYKPAGKPRKHLALVGKGLTFDSGGLSLKPSDSMEDMKIDMAGAAAMLGVMSVIAELAPDIEVHGIAGVCENMPSGKAVRPGDVVKTMSGKTVEILNTDAEGRVTLADTLHYALQLKPDQIVDLATLTGACMTALGQEVAGVLANSKPLAAKIMNCAAAAGELLWQLPLQPEYADSLKSRVADLKNISGTRYGGAITAGLFLKEFVGDAPWAHLDIAGPAWAEKESVPHQPLGGTGFGVRTMIKLIQSL